MSIPNQQITMLPPNSPQQDHDRVTRFVLGPDNKKQPLVLVAAGPDHAVEAVAALTSLAHQLLQPGAPLLNAPLYMELTRYPWARLEGLPQGSGPAAPSFNHDAAMTITFKAPPFPYWTVPHAHLIQPNADVREQACLLGFKVVVEAPAQATFGMAGINPDHQITIIAGQSGTLHRDLGNLLQRSLVSFLRHTGRLAGHREGHGDDHLLYVDARQLQWLHAERHSFFEATLSPGDHFVPHQPIGRLVQPFDAATPQTIACPYAGIVIATRQVRPVEAGDPIILVATTGSHG